MKQLNGLASTLGTLYLEAFKNTDASVNALKCTNPAQEKKNKIYETMKTVAKYATAEKSILHVFLYGLDSQSKPIRSNNVPNL